MEWLFLSDLILIFYILFWPIFYWYYAKYLLKMGPIFWSEYLQTEEGQEQIRNILDKDDSSLVQMIADYSTSQIAEWYNGKLGSAIGQVQDLDPKINIAKKLKKEHWAIQMVAEKLLTQFGGDFQNMIPEKAQEVIKGYQAGIK